MSESSRQGGARLAGATLRDRAGQGWSLRGGERQGLLGRVSCDRFAGDAYLKITCPHCGREGKMPATATRTTVTVRCPGCKQRFDVPPTDRIDAVSAAIQDGDAPTGGPGSDPDTLAVTVQVDDGASRIRQTPRFEPEP